VHRAGYMFTQTAAGVGLEICGDSKFIGAWGEIAWDYKFHRRRLHRGSGKIAPVLAELWL